MKKIIILLVVIFSVTIIGSSCSFHSTVEGDGNLTTKSYDVSEFTKIDASHSFEIDVVVGKSQSVKIETDENFLKYIEVLVVNGTLYLDLKDNVNLDGDVKAIIFVEALNSIDLSGACKINIENIRGTNFSVDVSGACKGTLSGTVENLNLDLSGATKINTVELIAQNLIADMSGASKLEVYCENSLSVDGSGASKITVYGNPKTIKTNFSGVSSVIFKWFLYFWVSKIQKI